MKHFIKILLSAFCALCLCACSGAQKSDEPDHLSIVATVFPAYEWCREVLGDNPGNIELTFLLDSGTDMHSYQPSAADMLKIADCDLFVYVGGESDRWTDGALRQAVNPALEAVSLMDLLDGALKEEETVEGMEEEEEEEEEAYDEHVWLSLRNAETAVAKIAEIISAKDPANADLYTANAQAYCKALSDLDEQYKKAVENAKVKTLVFADRFPFRYLTDDYHINYYAAFAGCSAETEASFETILFLASRMDELHLANIMTIEKNDEKIAKTVIENTEAKNQNILHLDSMQSTTSDDAKAKVTYLSVMESNLSVLKQALETQE